MINLIRKKNEKMEKMNENVIGFDKLPVASKSTGISKYLFTKHVHT
jgi:hypothetical protein